MGLVHELLHLLDKLGILVGDVFLFAEVFLKVVEFDGQEFLSLIFFALFLPYSYNQYLLKLLFFCSFLYVHNMKAVYHTK